MLHDFLNKIPSQVVSQHRVNQWRMKGMDVWQCRNSNMHININLLQIVNIKD